MRPDTWKRHVISSQACYQSSSLVSHTRAEREKQRAAHLGRFEECHPRRDESTLTRSQDERRRQSELVHDLEDHPRLIPVRDRLLQSTRSAVPVEVDCDEVELGRQRLVLVLRTGIVRARTGEDERGSARTETVS